MHVFGGRNNISFISYFSIEMDMNKIKILLKFYYLKILFKIYHKQISLHMQTKIIKQKGVFPFSFFHAYCFRKM
jgi:hypothetical protein